MGLGLIDIITSADPKVRDSALETICQSASFVDLLDETHALEQFRKQQENLYERVRALFFLYAIHRFHLLDKPELPAGGHVPFHGYEQFLSRRFEEAIHIFLTAQETEGPSAALSSALAAAYYRLGFQTLADQVRRSVRTVRGNQWMFRMGHPKDQPIRLRGELLRRANDGTYPILRERTPVRMDLTHSAWSDIFFLGMDFPEGARVLNVSVDLGVHGRDATIRPPISAWLRVIEEPVLRLVSVDLGARADIIDLNEVFDFAKDYLGLLKAAVVASGIVPPGIEGSGQSLADLLAQMLGPGRGLELVSSVNDIPKGSRLAVSTNLLAALISVCMRATAQAESLTGPLQEAERRLVLARALLGEWIGGSGGGWQDSGGVWPGIKLIEGAPARPGDPEYGVSRGQLMPTHHVFSPDEISAEARQRLRDSLVLVHGGMAQNVGPILEMVTEKYLLRSAAEWEGRQEALGILRQVLDALQQGDIRKVGAVTTQNFQGPIQTIIPWASTYYTERLVEQVRAEFGEDFWGFWMLGGMSGGGMGFIFAPARKPEAQKRLQGIMSELRGELQHALPFAMEPVVYDFAINENGTYADLLAGRDALMPSGYYALTVPGLLRTDPRSLSELRRKELDKFGAACRVDPSLRDMVRQLFDVMLPRGEAEQAAGDSLAAALEANGFDPKQHEAIRTNLREGRIGLAQNRLPMSAVIEDVRKEDVTDLSVAVADEAALRERGLTALRNGEVAVITLAAGAGSRWTQGAGVVKALHPFAKLGGRHRTFLEAHLAKSRRISRLAGTPLVHVFATSYLTHEPISQWLDLHRHYGYEGPLHLSRGKSVGLRMIPTQRDLRFAWEEMPQQTLDEQQQKMRASGRAALAGWARNQGEAADYTENLPLQCLHPVGHWYELPNLFLNGTLEAMLAERPQLKYLMMHNVDTLGADADPVVLGRHIASGACLSFEVITRRLEDRGGGLARLDGRPRLLEGLTMPREKDEFALTYYNTLTTWIDLDLLLQAFGLTRADFALGAESEEKIREAVRNLAARMPTYITLKDVKKRWGHGQEDVFPVTQFEKLWGDMSALPELDIRYLVVPRHRGHQLKDQAQLDGWLRDGSAAFVESICEWE
ncbi:MAG TPA: UTP--glucose-1-phosphate uridylyltransferase [Chthoniobacteraceae bacterium]|jgi:hypothetical protein|nr:UTP--glucose-1-phosphate uridylyltransferase [Chthoniobacteraceae bacterium]